MQEPKPYALSDITIKNLHRKAIKRFELAKRRLLIQGFDELNVASRLDALYKDLEQDNREAFETLYKARFKELEEYLKRRDTVDVMVEIELLLKEPNDVTHYAYDTEVLRKRDRAKEAIDAVPTKQQKQLELDKALRLWSQQTDQYCDLVSDAATVKAFQKAGVSKVIWNTQKDGKVCDTCHDREGQVYYVRNLPTKHPRCRCWITPL